MWHEVQEDIHVHVHCAVPRALDCTCRVYSFLFLFFSAPDAPPTDLRTIAVVLGEIFVSWAPPPINQRNGIIVNYIVTHMIPGQPPVTIVMVAGNKLNVSSTCTVYIHVKHYHSHVHIQCRCTCTCTS